MDKDWLHWATQQRLQRRQRARERRDDFHKALQEVPPAGPRASAPPTMAAPAPLMEQEHPNSSAAATRLARLQFSAASRAAARREQQEKLLQRERARHPSRSVVPAATATPPNPPPAAVFAEASCSLVTPLAEPTEADIIGRASEGMTVLEFDDLATLNLPLDIPLDFLPLEATATRAESPEVDRLSHARALSAALCEASSDRRSGSDLRPGSDWSPDARSTPASWHSARNDAPSVVSPPEPGVGIASGPPTAAALFQAAHTWANDSLPPPTTLPSSSLLKVAPAMQQQQREQRWRQQRPGQQQAAAAQATVQQHASELDQAHATLTLRDSSPASDAADGSATGGSAPPPPNTTPLLTTRPTKRHLSAERRRTKSPGSTPPLALPTAFLLTEYVSSATQLPRQPPTMPPPPTATMLPMLPPAPSHPPIAPVAMPPQRFRALPPSSQLLPSPKPVRGLPPSHSAPLLHTPPGAQQSIPPEAAAPPSVITVSLLPSSAEGLQGVRALFAVRHSCCEPPRMPAASAAAAVAMVDDKDAADADVAVTEVARAAALKPSRLPAPSPRRGRQSIKRTRPVPPSQIHPSEDANTSTDGPVVRHLLTRTPPPDPSPHEGSHPYAKCAAPATAPTVALPRGTPSLPLPSSSAFLLSSTVPKLEPRISTASPELLPLECVRVGRRASPAAASGWRLPRWRPGWPQLHSTPLPSFCRLPASNSLGLLPSREPPVIVVDLFEGKTAPCRLAASSAAVASLAATAAASTLTQQPVMLFSSQPLPHSLVPRSMRSSKSALRVGRSSSKNHSAGSSQHGDILHRSNQGHNPRAHTATESALTAATTLSSVAESEQQSAAPAQAASEPSALAQLKTLRGRLRRTRDVLNSPALARTRFLPPTPSPPTAAQTPSSPM